MPKFVSPAEGGSVVVARIKETLLGDDEEEIQRPTMGNQATNFISTICGLQIWLAYALICLIMGGRYSSDCDDLESNLPIYLIVQGVLSLIFMVTCGIGCGVLTNFRELGSWIVYVIAVINLVMSLMLIIWTIVGSVWVWNNWDDWDSNRSLCIHEIYLTAMAASLISIAFWFFVFAIAGCQLFWAFFNGKPGTYV